jgi:Mg/Co/Ni transporter MgtE
MKHDTDPVRLLTYRPVDRMRTLRAMTLPERSAVFEKLSPYVQQSILKQLKVHEIVDMLDHLDMQQAKHIMARLPNSKLREKVLARLKR